LSLTKPGAMASNAKQSHQDELPRPRSNELASLRSP
jgi:hypothetical protein